MKMGDTATVWPADLDPVRVGVLAYPGCFASEIYGIPDLLTIADRVAAQPTASFEVTVMSPRRRVIAAGDLDLAVQAVRPVDVLIVPGFDRGRDLDLETYLMQLGPEVELIKSHTAAGRPVVAVCLGAFVLGAAGLLQSRRATTSWLYADTLQRMHPAVDVHAESLVVTDNGVTTTGGFSAMYDVAIELIRANQGDAIARSTARLTLIDDARTTQTPYVEVDLLPQGGGRFAQSVMRHLDQHLATPFDLAAIAEVANVSPRTLLRRFAAETQDTPLRYLQKARIRRARHLLETTEQSVGAITAAVGYADQPTFARLFQRHVGLTPSQYRRSFGKAWARGSHVDGPSGPSVNNLIANN